MTCVEPACQSYHNRVSLTYVLTSQHFLLFSPLDLLLNGGYRRFYLGGARGDNNNNRCDVSMLAASSGRLREVSLRPWAKFGPIFSIQELARTHKKVFLSMQWTILVRTN